MANGVTEPMEKPEVIGDWAWHPDPASPLGDVPIRL
jgi:hypothetical protein